MRAANISPVPEKKQEMAGTDTEKIRGTKADVAVEPITEIVSVGEVEQGKRTDVMIMWGIPYVL